MREELEDAVIIANNFEKALITANIASNKVYWTTVYLKDIPQNKDLSEFLIEMVENSKKFTSNSIGFREFTLEEDSISPFIKLSVGFNDGRGVSGGFYIPYTSSFEDYLGIKGE